MLLLIISKQKDKPSINDSLQALKFGEEALTSKSLKLEISVSGLIKCWKSDKNCDSIMFDAVNSYGQTPFEHKIILEEIERHFGRNLHGHIVGGLPIWFFYLFYFSL